MAANRFTGVHLSFFECLSGADAAGKVRHIGGPVTLSPLEDYSVLGIHAGVLAGGIFPGAGKLLEETSEIDDPRELLQIRL